MNARLVRIISVIILWLVYAVSPVRAQVNIEKMREDGAGAGFSTDLSLLFSTRSGNVDITELGLSLRQDYVAQKSTSFLIVHGLYGWKDGDAFSNEGLLHLRHVRKDWKPAAPEFFTQVNYDKARLLDFRSLGGGGVRIRFFEGERLQMAWGTAYMIEYERFDLPPDAWHPRSNTHHRWSNYVSLKADLGESTTLAWTTYLQPRFDDFGDLKTLNDGELETDLVSRLALTVTIRLRYDGRPPDGIEKRDTLVLTGLRVEI
jgi:hypothetical protein